MKKLLLVVVLAIVPFSLYAQAFYADTNLLDKRSARQQNHKKTPNSPYLAVYKKGAKKLLLLGANHQKKDTHPFMQYAFDTFHPQIALVEFEPGREWEPCLAGEATYTAALAAKNNVPLVRADADLDWQWEFAHQHGFSYEDWQMMWIIRNAYYGAREGYKTNAAWEIQAYARREHDPAKGSLFTEETLLQYFQQYYGQDFNTTDFVKLFQDLQNIYPTQEISQTPFYRLSDITGRARSAFMIQNIAEALNQYDIVFIEMGSGHHVDMLRALKKMLGKPRYITAEQIPPQTLWEQCSLEGLEEKILIN